MHNDPTRICRGLFQEPRVGAVSLTMFVLAAMQLVLSLVIISWLYKQRRLARGGSERATRRLVLPAYLEVLWALAFCNAFTGTAMSLVPVYVAQGTTPWTSCATMGFAWGIYHWTLQGLQFFLMQRGAGRTAIRRAHAGGLAVGIFTFFPVYLFYCDGTSYLGIVSFLVWNLVLIAIAGSVVFLPRRLLFRRPAAVQYAKFFLTVRVLDLIGTAIRHYIDLGFCLELFSQWVLFGIAEPFVVYRALQLDSQWWQGLLAGDSESTSDLQKPLLGTQLSADAAANVASAVDSLSGRGHRVPHLDIRQLAFDGAMANVLGVGGSARVYKGTFQGRPVAIKLLLCVELTPEVVENFVREASLLARLRHRNVIGVRGVCIAPPALGMVLELCDDSLFDFLQKTVSHAEEHSTGAVPFKSADSNAAGHVMFTVSRHQRLQIAASCVRAVAFLHSRSILHRDVKSLNFLVQRQKAGAQAGEQSPRPVAPAVFEEAPSQAAASVSGGETDSLAARFREAPPLCRASTAATSTTASYAPYARGMRQSRHLQQRSVGSSSATGISDNVTPLFRNGTQAFLGSQGPLDRQSRTLSAGPGRRPSGRALRTMSSTGLSGAHKPRPVSWGRGSPAWGGLLPSARESPEVAVPSCQFLPAPEVEVKIADFELSRRFDAAFARGGRQASVAGQLPISRVLHSDDAAAKPSAGPSGDGAAFSTLHLTTHHSDGSVPGADQQSALGGCCGSICGCCGRAEAPTDVEATPGEPGAAEYALEGTANWAAPEVLRGDPYTFASDCYAVALVVWECFSHQVPFSQHKSRDAVIDAVLCGERPTIAPELEMPDAVQSLLHRAWDDEPSRRPSVQSLLETLEREAEQARTVRSQE